MTKRPTDKQKEARRRSWRIFQLRGLWHQCHMLSPLNRAVACAAVDLKLAMLGAETQTTKRERERRELMEQYDEQDREHAADRQVQDQGQPLALAAPRGDGDAG